MKTQKKITAALAAVSAYITSEEEALARSAMFVPAPEELPAKPSPAAASAWGVSARLDQMSLRGLMQLKAFHGARFK